MWTNSTVRRLIQDWQQTSRQSEKAVMALKLLISVAPNPIIGGFIDLLARHHEEQLAYFEKALDEVRVDE